MTVMDNEAATKTIAFDEVVHSFYGCTIGNVDSPIWICGLEWGGGLSLEEPTPIESFAPYGFKELQCLDTKDFECSFWAPRSPFCRAVIKILSVLLKGELLSWKDFSDLEREGIVGRDGIALILNANPITFSNRDEARKEWNNFCIRLSDGEILSLKEWTSFESFECYNNEVRKIRNELFVAERIKRKPRIIIACGYDAMCVFLDSDKLGDAKSKNWKELFDPSLRISSKEEKKDVWCKWLKNSEDEQEDTLLVWQDFPGRRFNQDNQYKTAYNKVREIYKDKMGCEWFEGSLNKERTSLSHDEKLIESIRAVEEARNEISKYKRQCSGLLSTLEMLEKPNNNAIDVLGEVSKKKERILEIYPLFDRELLALIKKDKELRKTFRAKCGKGKY